MFVDPNSYHGEVLFQDTMDLIERSRIITLFVGLKPTTYVESDGTHVCAFNNGQVIGKGKSLWDSMSDFYKNVNGFGKIPEDTQK